ncbi:MAG TPA: glycosyltransferase [Solirubrobacteraceae bacterium]|nr:glycosyltransferase [Solirubrobacteraceae bacterium]
MTLTASWAANERLCRVDMHCHSTASQVSKLGVQRAAGLPECATPPEEVYELAKRRNMDFVTITDHDTIAGVLEIADLPDVFVSEELTAHFRNEPSMAIHVLCYDIDLDDHEWLQGHRHDVELCAAYMYEREIACALAHPYYAVDSPLTPRHRRRLAELFGVWEVRNGARAPELNRPAATYAATRETIGIGGSDDHAGIDIGRTYTETPAASSPPEFLAHVLAGRARAGGAQGSAAKWAHSAIVLAARSLAPRRRDGMPAAGADGSLNGAVRARANAANEISQGPPDTTTPDEAPHARANAANEISQGPPNTTTPDEAPHARANAANEICRGAAVTTPTNQDLRARANAASETHQETSTTTSPNQAPHTRARTVAKPPSAYRPDPRRVMTMVRRLLREGDARQGATNRAHGEDGLVGAVSPEDARCLLGAWLSAVGLDHLDTDGLIAYMQHEDFSHGDLYRKACRAHERKLREAVELALEAAKGEAGMTAAAEGLFGGCIAAIPYAPASAFLANEQTKLARLPYDEEPEIRRVAILADGIGSTHGVSRTIEEIRERGVEGYEIEVIGTDPHVDKRLSAVAEIDVPYYPGLQIGVPSLPAAVQTLADGAFDAIHVCSPGPVGAAGALLARALGLPLIGSYHTELTAYAQLRSQRPELAGAMALAVGTLYGACDVVLSPSAASDEALAEIGVPAEKVMRWDRGVDTARFDPALRDPTRLLCGRPAGPVAGSPADTGLDDSPTDPDSRARECAEAINVMYSGRITREKGAELLAETFNEARRRGGPDIGQRLHLVLAGGGPEQERLRELVGAEHVTFLGWLSGHDLARAYASADVFLFASATDTFGQVILEAQASGLPVVAVAEGGPTSLIEQRVSGLLCPADAKHLADAVLEVAGSPLLRERLTRGGLAAARGRTWELALARLGEGYGRALAQAEPGRLAPAHAA